jgi:hypothetical protein
MALAGLAIITTVDFEKGYIFADTMGGSLPENDKDAKNDTDADTDPKSPRENNGKVEKRPVYSP